MTDLLATDFTNAASAITLGLTGIGVIAACLRMVLGPSRADRVIALDLVTILLVAITALLALETNNTAYLDLGLALALVGFLTIVAFARYVERRSTCEEDQRDLG